MLKSIDTMLGDPVASLRERLGNVYNELTRLPELPGLDAPTDGPGVQAVAGTFSEALSRLIDDVETRQARAEQAVKTLLTGGDIEIHQVMMAVERASIAFQMLTSVRNRLLESYQDMMHLQM